MLVFFSLEENDLNKALNIDDGMYQLFLVALICNATMVAIVDNCQNGKQGSSESIIHKCSLGVTLIADMDYIVKSAPFDSTRNTSVRPELNHNIYQLVFRTM